MYAEHKVILGKYHRLVLAPDGYDEAFGAHVDVVFNDIDEDWPAIKAYTPAKIRFNVSFGNAPMDVTEVEEWAEVLDAAALIARGQDVPEWRLPANVLAEWEKARAAMNEAHQ